MSIWYYLDYMWDLFTSRECIAWLLVAALAFGILATAIGCQP